jgi:hypothetical protein
MFRNFGISRLKKFFSIEVAKLAFTLLLLYNLGKYAGVAQLLERFLAKEEVES